MSLGRNTAINIAGAILPTVISLATVPVFIQLIGQERYGVLSIAWLFSAYFNFFDLGLSRATTQRIAVLGRDARQAAADVVWTAFASNLVLGLLGGLVLWMACPFFFGGMFRADSAVLAEVRPAYPLLALSVPLATLAAVLSGALAGRLRFGWNALADVVSASLSLLLPLAAAWQGHTDVGVLVLLTVAARLAGMVLAGVLVWREVLASCRPRFDRAEWQGLIRFGGWATLSALASPLIMAGDRFMVGAVFGAAAVTAYAVPYQIANRLLLFPNAAATALFPKLSGESDAAAARSSAVDAQVTISLLFAPMIAGLIAIVDPLLRLWLQGSFDPRSVAVGQIALIGVWFNALAGTPFALIQSRGDSRFTGLLHVAEIVPYFAVLWWLGNAFGLAGVCSAFALRCLVDLLVLQAKGFGFRETPVLVHVPPLVAMIGAMVLSDRAAGGGLVQLGWGTLIGVLLCAYGAWQVPPPVRDAVLALVRRLFGRYSQPGP